jgi:hypothetical protein
VHAALQQLARTQQGEEGAEARLERQREQMVEKRNFQRVRGVWVWGFGFYFLAVLFCLYFRGFGRKTFNVVLMQDKSLLSSLI